MAEVIAVDTSDKEVTDVYAIANRLANAILSFNFWKDAELYEEKYYYDAVEAVLYKSGVLCRKRTNLEVRRKQL